MQNTAAWYAILMEVVDILLKSRTLKGDNIRNVRALRNFMEIFDSNETRRLIASHTKAHACAIKRLTTERNVSEFAEYVSQNPESAPYIGYQVKVTSAISQLGQEDSDACWQKLSMVQQMICDS